MPKFEYQSASYVVKVNVCKWLIDLRTLERLKSILVHIVIHT